YYSNTALARTASRTAGIQVWSLIMQLEYKLGHYSKIPPTTTSCPEEIGVLRVGRLEDVARGCHNSDLYQIVNNQAILSREPPKAASKGKSINSELGYHKWGGDRRKLPSWNRIQRPREPVIDA